MTTAPQRRAVLALGLGAAMAAALPAAGQGTFPSRPVTFIVPFEPGANGDIIARLVAAGMSKVLGQTVVVDNKSGAGGMLGTGEASRQPADGYTIVLVTNVQAVNMTLMKDSTVDILGDLDAVTQLTKGTNILVVKKESPFRSTREFLDYVKAHPGELSYASSGIGSTGQLTMEYLKYLAGGLDILHIPYKGGQAMYNDLLAGRVDVAFGSTSGSLPLIAAGELVALGVSSPTKTEITGDLPAIADEVPGFSVEHWQGIMAPKGTPPEAIRALHDAAVVALQDPAVAQQLATLGIQPVGSTPEDFTVLVASEIEDWGKFLVEAKIAQ